MFRFLPDTAGVDEDEVGLFGVFCFKVMGPLQETKDALRVVLVHLTTVGFDVDTLLWWHIYFGIAWGVIPTQVGIRKGKTWIPAFAGMTFRVNEFLILIADS